MSFIKGVLLMCVLVLAGCTSIDVSKLDASHEVYHVCIKDNPDVVVGNFLGVVQNGFMRHGITTEVYTGDRPPYCEYHMTYTALKTWDMATYMHHAELRLFRENAQVGYAEYHLNGKGGLKLNKWAGVDSKMDPVIDRLLSDYTPEMVDTFREAIPRKGEMADKSLSPTSSESDLTRQLRQLKDWFDEGLINQEEYDAERSELLGS